MKHYFRVSKIKEPKKDSTRKNFFRVHSSIFNVTNSIILFTLLVFFLSFLIGFFSEDCSSSSCNFLALQPSSFVHGQFWTILTSIFLHAGFFHLFVNMLSLYFIGTFLEMLIGKKRFFWFYILSGIFAGLFFVLFAYLFGNNPLGARVFGGIETFAVGASGAIFGIAGVLALLTPKNKVYLIAGPLLAFIALFILQSFSSSPWVGLLNIIVNIYLFFSIFVMFSFNQKLTALALPIRMPFWLIPIFAILPFMILSIFVQLPLGNMAHLGGFVAGLAYGAYLRLRYKKKTQAIADYFC